MITENIIKAHGFEWVDVQEPTEQDIDRLTSEFGIPYLLVLDCLKPEHLPKYEETSEGHFLMMRNFDPESPTDATTVQALTRKIALLITENRIVTIHRVHHRYLEGTAERCGKPQYKKDLPALVHEIIYETIKTYDVPIERLQDQYETFESEVLSKRCRLSTIEMYQFRRQIFVLKRLLKQTQEALYRFREFWERDPSKLQDLRENIDQAYFSLDEVADNFDHLFQLNVALSDQRANDIMKTLTVFSSVLLPLNFLASFYGMNFTMLPGLRSEHAFYWLCASMIFLGIITLYYFHHRGWFHFRQRND